jgi:hypothetical protein
MGYKLNGRDSIPDKWKEYYFVRGVQTGSGAHPASIQWVPGALSLELKRPEREADHSRPFDAEVKNSAAIPSLPRMFSRRCSYLIKHRDNLTIITGSSSSPV